VLYSFTGQNEDGVAPTSALVRGPNGGLYGTTWMGGAANVGTVFRLTPPAVVGGNWTETVLHSFIGGSGDGAWVPSPLVLAPSGALYGTTVFGGSGACALPESPLGCGTVFELKPPAVPGGDWTESVIYSFAGPPYDGEETYAGLVIGSNGTLYGTTILGGTYGTGTVFELIPPTAGALWTEYRLTDFPTAGDPFVPWGGLVMDAKGNLYGTTLGGGTSMWGAVYELTPPSTSGATWTLSVPYSSSSTVCGSASP